MSLDEVDRWFLDKGYSGIPTCNQNLVGLIAINEEKWFGELCVCSVRCWHVLLFNLSLLLCACLWQLLISCLYVTLRPSFPGLLTISNPFTSVCFLYLVSCFLYLVSPVFLIYRCLTSSFIVSSWSLLSTQVLSLISPLIILLKSLCRPFLSWYVVSFSFPPLVQSIPPPWFISRSVEKPCPD